MLFIYSLHIHHALLTPASYPHLTPIATKIIDLEFKLEEISSKLSNAVTSMKTAIENETLAISDSDSQRKFSEEVIVS